MPIYEYECSYCHQHFDLIQKINDAPATQCPQCFKNTAVRLVSAPGFQLKGSGWYATDFKNNDKKKPVPAASSKTTESSTDKVKSKPEISKESKK